MKKMFISLLSLSLLLQAQSSEEKQYSVEMLIGKAISLEDRSMPEYDSKALNSLNDLVQGNIKDFRLIGMDNESDPKGIFEDLQNYFTIELLCNPVMITSHQKKAHLSIGEKRDGILENGIDIMFLPYIENDKVKIDFEIGNILNMVRFNTKAKFVLKNNESALLMIPGKNQENNIFIIFSGKIIN